MFSINKLLFLQTFLVFSYLGGSGSEGADEADFNGLAMDFRSCVISADNSYFYVGGNTNSTDLKQLSKLPFSHEADRKISKTRKLIESTVNYEPLH